MTPFSLFLSQRALEWAIALARLTPSAAEQALPPDQSVDYLLYCSAAIRPLHDEQLADLLEQARAHNKRNGITGLLCYDEGHFVQVIEGHPDEVNRLFARIERDPRHHHVQLLCRGTSARREFIDWHMVFTKSSSQDFYWLISYLEATHYQLLLPQVPVPEPGLLPLLRIFSRTCADILPRPSPPEPSYAGLLPF
jgi:nucleotide-binding universal stress UspA family protein